MALKNHILVIICVIVWAKGTAGAAFSNVVVQRDGVVPVDYYTYIPSSLAVGNSQAAQLSAIPFESAVQAPSSTAIVTPCLAPCIIPKVDSQGLLPIPSTSNAKIITFNPAVPNVPIVTTNKEAPRGYQYAYAVYDDHTGDKKSQSEQSDGSVVQGQYSFIQPDGFRREVVYTADDVKGFNALVRNIPPEPELPKETKEEVAKPQPTPCPEPKRAQLMQTHEKSVEIPQTESKIVPKNYEINIENIEEAVTKNPKDKSEKTKPLEEKTSKSGEPIEPNYPVLTNVISYNDIIKCLQAKLLSAKSATSPLTYILIPSLNGPC